MRRLISRQGAAAKWATNRKFSGNFQYIINDKSPLVLIKKDGDNTSLIGLLSAFASTLCAILTLKSNAFGEDNSSHYNQHINETIFMNCVRDDQIETNAEECKSRGKPWSTYHTTTNFPHMILYPESTEVCLEILHFVLLSLKTTNLFNTD